jgi:hypothetical protein
MQISSKSLGGLGGGETPPSPHPPGINNATEGGSIKNPKIHTTFGFFLMWKCHSQ